MFRTEDVIDRDEFHAIADRLGRPIFRARKKGRVAARKAAASTEVVTRWNGAETKNVAEAGDWIVTALGQGDVAMRDKQGEVNEYVIKPAKFDELYTLADGAPETPHGAVYAPKGEVSAIELPEGFDILAPWGERQRAESGYLLLNGDDVYGNAKETFEATYERLD